MQDEPSLSEIERDVVTLASIANPLSMDVIRSVIELDDAETSDIVDRLAGMGAITLERRGVTAEDPGGPPARRSMLASRLLAELDRRQAPTELTAAAAWAAGDASRAYADYRSTISAGASEPELLDRAVEAGEDSGAPAAEIAGLRVRRAIARRNRGESDAAMADLEASLHYLEGAELVDALAFAGAIQDDLQHPADAERYVAMGMLVAADLGLMDKLGSLATLHGRFLSRVGFSQEADDSFERGLALVGSHGNEVQRFYSELNQAWTSFDRGWMAKAEQGYAGALRDAARIESEVSAADKEVYLARARFGSGDPAEAAEGLARARTVAASTGAPVLEFLATIADVEGALLYERPDDARSSVERLAGIVERSFPAWVNRLATLQARVELQAGDRSAARRAIAIGLEATPHGANGARLRAELEALGLAAADDWDSHRAAELNDRIIQAGWLGLAAWLMIERCRRDGDPEVGMIAAGLAHRLGNPMLAARAVAAAERWDDPRAGAVALAVERVARNLPDEWESDFVVLPFVSPGLYRAGQIEQADDGALIAGLDSALAAAGLSGVDVLSPAQRRAAGLIAAPSRVRSAFRWIAPLVGAAAVAAIVAVLLVPDPVVPDDSATPTTTSVVTTTTLPPPEERLVPGDDLLGQSAFAGGDLRNPVYDVELGEPIGYYWRQPVSGFVGNDPVLQGKALYVGTSQGFLSAFDVDNTGSVIFEDRQSDAISSSVSVGLVSYDQGGQSRTLVFYGDQSGAFHARNVDDARGQAWPAVDLGSAITGPPLIRTDYVIVATTDGVLYKLEGSTGEEIGRYPAEEPVETGFAEPIAAANGTIYAVTGDGVVKVIDEETLTEICEVTGAAGAAVTNVMIVESQWFFGSATTSLRAFEEGTCSSSPIPAYQIDVPVSDTPPIQDGVIWAPADGLILSLNLDDGQGTYVPTNLEGTITSPPIVAGQYLLVGVSRSGQNELVAVSTDSGEVAWRFGLPQPLRTRPVVGDGLIVVATDLELIAIAAPAN